MSLTKPDSKQRSISRAEIRFIEAFERLKLNKPEILPLGTPVSQNNVAKEGGVDPSALRSSRYPDLTNSIKNWVDENQNDPIQKSDRQKALAKRSRNKQLLVQVENLKEQRDNAFSKLVQAQRQILELTIENEKLKSRLPAINVSKLI